jgi:hypothetical protein
MTIRRAWVSLENGVIFINVTHAVTLLVVVTTG